MFYVYEQCIESETNLDYESMWIDQVVESVRHGDVGNIPVIDLDSDSDFYSSSESDECFQNQKELQRYTESPQAKKINFGDIF